MTEDQRGALVFREANLIEAKRADGIACQCRVCVSMVSGAGEHSYANSSASCLARSEGSDVWGRFMASGLNEKPAH
jgi:hypothetical protein